MKMTLGNNEKRIIPGRPGRKALVAYLKTGSCVYGFEPTTGAADTLGAELAGGAVFNTGWSQEGGEYWVLAASTATYEAAEAAPNRIIRSVTGMTAYGAHVLEVEVTDISGAFSVFIDSMMVATFSSVGTHQWIIYPGAGTGVLAVAPQSPADENLLILALVSLRAFTETEGLPLPEEQQIGFFADNPRSLAGPIYLSAGGSGAEVLIIEQM